MPSDISESDSDTDSDSIRIQIKSLDDPPRVVSIDIKASNTISMLKAKVEGKFKYPHDMIRMIFNGQHVYDWLLLGDPGALADYKCTLSDFGVDDGATFEIEYIGLQKLN